MEQLKKLISVGTQLQQDSGISAAGKQTICDSVQAVMHGQRRRGSVLRDFEGIAERAAHARVASRRTGDPTILQGWTEQQAHELLSQRGSRSVSTSSDDSNDDDHSNGDVGDISFGHEQRGSELQKQANRRISTSA